jgi:hypothetical protein
MDEIPKHEDNLSSSGTKSSPHLSKDSSPQNASLRIAIPGSCDTQKPQSSKSAESPKATPPNNPCHGINLLAKILLVVTLLCLNLKVFLDEPRW